MAGRTQDMDAREIVGFVATLSAAMLAASIATVIAIVMFGIFGDGFFEEASKAWTIGAITFAGTFVGAGIGFRSSVASLRRQYGPWTLGASAGGASRSSHSSHSMTADDA